MQETIQSILKRTPILLLLAGLLLLLIAAAAGVSLKAFTLSVSDPAWRIALGAIGTVLIGLGTYTELSGRARRGSISTDDAKVRIFQNRQAYTEHRMQSLRRAKMVKDVSWRVQGYSEQTYSGGDLETRQEELDLIARLVKKPEVDWKGVAVFSALEQLERVRPLITDERNVGYNLGIYEADPRAFPPLVGFMIVDDQELFLAYPHRSIRLTIQDPEIVKLFLGYFDDIWQGSHKIKKGSQIDRQKVEQLVRDLTTH